MRCAILAIAAFLMWAPVTFAGLRCEQTLINTAARDEQARLRKLSRHGNEPFFAFREALQQIAPLQAAEVDRPKANAASFLEMRRARLQILSELRQMKLSRQRIDQIFSTTLRHATRLDRDEEIETVSAYLAGARVDFDDISPRILLRTGQAIFKSLQDTSPQNNSWGKVLESVRKLEKEYVESRNDMVNFNIPFVLWWINRWGDAPPDYGQNRMDFLQDAFLLMVRAAEIWDPAKGQFSTFLFQIMKNLEARQFTRQRIARKKFPRAKNVVVDSDPVDLDGFELQVTDEVSAVDVAAGHSVAPLDKMIEDEMIANVRGYLDQLYEIRKKTILAWNSPSHRLCINILGTYLGIYPRRAKFQDERMSATSLGREFKLNAAKVRSILYRGMFDIERLSLGETSSD